MQTSPRGRSLSGGAGIGGAGITVETPRGPAGVRLMEPAGPATALLVLGHGAGGGVDAPDLVAVRGAALAAGIRVALVTQPYRVAGRRAPAPATHLDEAWISVVRHLRDPLIGGTVAPAGPVPLICGGRSSGARVACRTAAALGAVGVLALAFPLHPPGRPERSRAAELPTDLPTLVVNGDRDAFGVPEPTGLVTVQVRPGEGHDLRRDPAAVANVVIAWLRSHGWAAPERAAPDQAAPDQAAPDQAAPDQAAPDQAAPDQAAPDQARPTQGSSGG